MSTDSSSRGNTDASRIDKRRVRVIDEPIIVDHGIRGAGSLTVTPIFDGRTIQSLEIRCSCGQSLGLDCVYEDEAPAGASLPNPHSSAS